MCTNHKVHGEKIVIMLLSSVLPTPWEHMEMSGNTYTRKGITFLDL